MNNQCKKLIYFWLNFMFFNSINSQNRVGDSCRLGNERAVCREYEKCEDYSDNYSFYEKNLKYCGNSDYIICCREVPPKNPTYNRAPVKPAVTKESKSEKKCKEYRYVVSRNVSQVSLIPGEPDTIHELPKCEKYFEKLIVGGVDAISGEFPHMAVLGYSNRIGYDWKCGGTLISDLYVLTAAHCITKNGPHVVRLGEHNLGERLIQKKNTQEIQIRRSIVHPDYKRAQKIHDIGLLLLLKKVRISEKIRPACLYTDKNRLPDKFIATGWGLTEEGGERSNILQKVMLDFLPKSQCNNFYRGDFPKGLIEDQFCAGTPGKDTCQGDSGGPLQIKDKSNECVFYVVGITSTGLRCGFKAAVYTNVASHIDWIESKVW